MHRPSDDGRHQERTKKLTLVAGVDSSTQSVKIVVCDAETGAVVRSSRAPHPEGTEVSAAAWWEAYRAAAEQPGSARRGRGHRRRVASSTGW